MRSQPEKKMRSIKHWAAGCIRRTLASYICPAVGQATKGPEQAMSTWTCKIYIGRRAPWNLVEGLSRIARGASPLGFHLRGHLTLSRGGSSGFFE